jgi:sugar phosphate isomerase/epimerase
MYRAISFGAVNVNPGAGFEAAVKMAKKYGFKGIEASPHQILEYGTKKAVSLLDGEKMVISGFGLPVHPINGSKKEWELGIEQMPAQAKVMEEAGVDRCCIWLLNSNDTLDYEQNFEFHKERLTPFAEILEGCGIRLGLEFIGTESLLKKGKYPFIHTAEKMLELAAACGPNCGLLLDAWHWYMSGGGSDLFRVIGDQKYIVNVHINDAPKGDLLMLPDSPRALPGETGQIDIEFFMNGLSELGYDGPIVAEPFSPVLAAMGDDGEKMELVKKSFDKIWPAL